MTDYDPQEPLRAPLAELARAGIVPAAARRLRETQEAFSQRLAAVIADEVPAFTATGNPDVLPRLAAHLDETTADVIALFRGGPLGDAGHAADYARWCSERKFPLEAVLLAYRAIQEDLLTWLREAALASANEDAPMRRVVGRVTEFVLRYTESLSTVAASAYVAHTRAVAEAEGDRRTKLLQLLLHGFDESDTQAAALLRRSGYLEQRQSYCVVIAQPVQSSEMESAARAERLADAIKQAVQNVAVRSIVAVQDTEVVAVVSKTRRLSGWTPQQASTAESLRQPLLRLGPSVLVGVSNDVPSTSHVPDAYREASLALECADPSARVVYYRDIPLRQMLLRSARDVVRDSLPAWSESFATANQKSRGTLYDTIRAYADASMNVQKAAILLDVHPNTLYARMQKIRTVTGKNVLNFHDLNELLIAADCA